MVGPPDLDRIFPGASGDTVAPESRRDSNPNPMPAIVVVAALDQALTAVDGLWTWLRGACEALVHGADGDAW
jgi:hypothetical protein